MTAMKAIEERMREAVQRHDRCVPKRRRAVSVPLPGRSCCRVTLLGWKTGSARSAPPALPSRPPTCDRQSPTLQPDPGDSAITAPEGATLRFRPHPV